VVITDLEMAAAAHDQPVLLRLLGDAYMENGQLTRALESYRRALDLL
jgi:cytochrome c-type biogenesis protein CcmH/NrfG